MRVNEKLSEVIDSSSTPQLKVVVETDSFEAGQSLEARKLAATMAISLGFSGGQSNLTPVTVPYDGDGNDIELEKLYGSPNKPLTAGFRTTFIFSQRI